MFTKRLAILLVIANVIYSECRPQTYQPQTELVKENLLKSEVFNNIIQQIWQQISSQYLKPQQGQQPPADTQNPTSSPPTISTENLKSPFSHQHYEYHINEEIIKKTLFNNEAFSNLIQQIWQQVSEQYVNPQEGLINQPIEENQPPNVLPSGINSYVQHGYQSNKELMKKSIFNSEVFNNLIQQIWQQVSAQYVNPQTGQINQPEGTQPPINVDTVKNSLFNSETFNNVIQQIWQQVSQQYLNSQTTRPPIVNPTQPPSSPTVYYNLGKTTDEKAAAINAKYSFLTEIIDNNKGSYQYREEKRENGKTVGTYSYDDGTVFRAVNYEADNLGYRVLSDTTQSSQRSRAALDGTVTVKIYQNGVGGEYTYTA